MFCSVCVSQENKVSPFKYVSAISSLKEVGVILLLLSVQIFKSSLASETIVTKISVLFIKEGKQALTVGA